MFRRGQQPRLVHIPADQAPVRKLLRTGGGQLDTPDRCEVLDPATHGLLLAEADDLAQLITREVGKPMREARGEVEYAAAFALWFAEEARRICGRTALGGGSGKTWRHLVRQPVGVVGAITPWKNCTSRMS